MDSQTTEYHWLGSQLIAEYQGGQLSKTYSYATGYAPIEISEGNNTYTVHADHLDTPRYLTDQSGQIVWHNMPSPYGISEVDEDPDGDGSKVSFNIRFPGQYFDDETGLHYNYFRYYDPSTGRYITADPIGLLRDYSDPQLQLAIEAGALEETGFAGEELNHLYSYVGQNPLYWFDPYGLAEHTTNSRPSNQPKHEAGDARRQRDSGNEKGDKNRRENRKKPKGHKGSWPPRIPGLPALICPLCPLVFPPPNGPPSC